MAGFRNLFHNASGQTTDRAKFCALLPQPGQKRLTGGIDERYAGQVDHRVKLLVHGHLMPIGIEFLDPRACEPPFKYEGHGVRRCTSLSGDLQHFLFPLAQIDQQMLFYRQYSHSLPFEVSGCHMEPSIIP